MLQSSMGSCAKSGARIQFGDSAARVENFFFFFFFLKKKEKKKKKG